MESDLEAFLSEESRRLGGEVAGNIFLAPIETLGRVPWDFKNTGRGWFEKE